HTTRLFERLSGLRDPRKGRSLLSTYHADYALFRYPIDHVFVSEGFAVRALERVRIPESDHLGVVADLVLLREEGVKPNPDGDDQQEAQEIVEEGKEDAAEDGER
ncbi:MAG: endonuclease/exonuclease/phosphatase family protein, partial [Phycisphaerales bacterium]